ANRGAGTLFGDDSALSAIHRATLIARSEHAVWSGHWIDGLSPGPGQTAAHTATLWRSGFAAHLEKNHSRWRGEVFAVSGESHQAASHGLDELAGGPFGQRPLGGIDGLFPRSAIAANSSLF